MDINEMQEKLERLPSFLIPLVEKLAKKVPSIRKQIEEYCDEKMNEMEHGFKPYREDFTTYTRLPGTGVSRTEILGDMRAMKAREESRWKKGFVSGAVYHGDDKHIDFLNKVYAINSQSNPLHSDLWPSASKFEAEIIAMTAGMMSADRAGPAPDGKLGLSGDDHRICGSVSSGGTESILLAMKTYRDHARDIRGITRPNMVVPSTAHAAFDKASQYFKIKKITVPFGPDYRADVAAMKRAVNRNTIVVAGSAPSFPHGVVDPIAELSEIARARGIGFHTDACLGGFLLPWAERLGRTSPPFDFRLPGVTSMSADTHKFGYAAKGTSVVLYRGHALRRYQYYTTADWPGGMYFSPTFAGSRPGALAAACWAAMTSMGEKGYTEAARKIFNTAEKIKQGIAEIPELRVLGDSLFVIALASDELDIYRVMDFMTKKNWNLNGLHKPSSMHLCVTLRHTQAGVAARFIKDLKVAVAHVKANPSEEGGMAPIYGMAANLPLRGPVHEMLKRVMDLLYKA